MSRGESQKLFCTLCGREADSISHHHLTPRSLGGVETVPICPDCHRQIHGLFDNKTLEKSYNSVESLLESEKFSKYLKWAANKPVGAASKARKSKERRRSRKK